MEKGLYWDSVKLLFNKNLIVKKNNFYNIKGDGIADHVNTNV